MYIISQLLVLSLRWDESSHKYWKSKWEYLTILSFLFPLFSHPGYFGKVGMRHYHLKRNTTYCPTVNLDKLWTLVSEQTRVNYAKKPEGPAPIIDAVRAVSISLHYQCRVNYSTQSRHPSIDLCTCGHNKCYSLFLWYWTGCCEFTGSAPSHLKGEGGCLFELSLYSILWQFFTQILRKKLHLIGEIFRCIDQVQGTWFYSLFSYLQTGEFILDLLYICLCVKTKLDVLSVWVYTAKCIQIQCFH